MGHRSSKFASSSSLSATANSNTSTTDSTTENHIFSFNQSNNNNNNNSNRSSSNLIPIPFVGVGQTLNLQIEESPTTSRTALSLASNSSVTSVNASHSARQIIIKIQLAKMEEDDNGNEGQIIETEFAPGADDDINSNGSAPILNLTLTRESRDKLDKGTRMSSNSSSSSSSSSAASKLKSSSSKANRTAGSSSSSSSATSSSSSIAAATNADRRNANHQTTTMRSSRYRELAEDFIYDQEVSLTDEGISNRASSGTNFYSNDIKTLTPTRAVSPTGSSASKNSPSKRSTVKNTYRNAIRRILDSSGSTKSNKQQQDKQQLDKQQQTEQPRYQHHQYQNQNERKEREHSSDQMKASGSRRTDLPNKSKDRTHRAQKPKQIQHQQMSPAIAAPPVPAATPIVTQPLPTLPPPPSILPPLPPPPPPASMNPTTSTSSQFGTIWAAAAAAQAAQAAQAAKAALGNSDVIVMNSPQFVVLQCPTSSLMTLEQIVGFVGANTMSTASSSTFPTGSVTSGGSITAITPTKPALPPLQQQQQQLLKQTGPIVHSQVDFRHCLVPDLDKITKASFYWGKMDRYEAERLLEGKPEGTFLLRDSAQEEFLFSVTFRKYGRSLHARIEQSGHKFSFDCHDPCVFTAPTVTGLLQHYKDPACVMFFEPMLTIPLHRHNTFSLQQLCRATIVSNTSYDGISELELPVRLKAYLKEYHYKQKLRVKPFDEPFYGCT